MGKYLQNVIFYGPSLSLKGISVAQRNAYSERYSAILESIQLIEILYNYYLPAKFETGHQIWRFAIHLEESSNNRIEEVGFVANCFQPFSHTFLTSLAAFERRKQLLDLFQAGIRQICRQYHCSPQPFELVYQTIQSKGIILSEVLNKPKWSPKRLYQAQLYAFRSEELAEVSVLITDKVGEMLQKILVSDRDFRDFGTIAWKSNDTLSVSYLRWLPYYQRKKVKSDYFEVSFHGSVTFVPVSREALFGHAMELLDAGEEKPEEALDLLRSAEQLGHGKATNVLTNLAINPQEQNLAKLTQMQKKKAGKESG
jgi:hypothetical protein